MLDASPTVRRTVLQNCILVLSPHRNVPGTFIDLMQVIQESDLEFCFEIKGTGEGIEVNLLASRSMHLLWPDISFVPR